jgi:hypothetical protein
VNDANPYANPSINTTYTLTVTDLCGKQATAKINVIVNGTKPPVKITALTHTICDGDVVKLNATSNSNYLYQWYLNGKKINGATDSFYNAKKAGSYKVWVSYGLGGCDSTSKVLILKKCTAKEFEFASDNDASISSLPAYSIFPNPAKNVVTITLPASALSSVITVFDMNGKIVLCKKLNSNSTTEQINISSFAAGMYRIVWQQKEKQYSWKLVKQ